MHEHEQRQHCLTRERLIEAAGEIFAEKGLHGARIRDITQKAGANIAAVNYHFRDKFELYTTVLRRAHEDTIAAMMEPLTSDDPEDQIRQLLRSLLSRNLDPDRPKWHTLLLGRELVQPTPALDRLHDDLKGPVSRLSEAVAAMLPDRPELQRSLPTCNLVALVMFYVHHRHLISRIFPDHADPDLEEVITNVVEFSLSALRGMQSSQE